MGGSSRESRGLFGFIPQHIPNAVVLHVYDLTAGHRRFLSDCFSAVQGIPSEKSFSDSPKATSHGSLYIEDQRRRSDEPFGRSTVALAGCEVIAVYNALLCLIGRPLTGLTELVQIFKQSGMALGGRWGTSPRAIARFLTQPVFRPLFTVTTETETDRFDLCARGCTCMILSFYNDGADIRRGVHTVCLTREEQGFFAHNQTEDGHVQGPYVNASDFLNRAGSGRARGLYGIFLFSC